VDDYRRRILDVPDHSSHNNGGSSRARLLANGTTPPVPTLTDPNVPRNGTGDLLYGTNAGNSCAAFIRLDDVRVVDNCSGTNVTISAKA
jgi:hypothetical protein